MGYNGLLAGLAACALLVPGTALAQKKLGAGPYYNTKYEMVSTGTSSTSTPDGGVTLTTDAINTINCSGCDRVYYYPGTLFNVRNNTKKPLCFVFNFKPKAGEFNGVTSWGSGQVLLIRPRQTVSKFAGITMNFSRRSAEIGYDGSFKAWDPVSKKSCGPAPGA